MKLIQNRNCFIVYALAFCFIFSSCEEKTKYFEKVDDGYVFTVDEELVNSIPDTLKSMGITFISLIGNVSVDSTTIMQLLADGSRVSTVEGPVSKIGRNKIKIRTNRNLSVNLNDKFGVFYGLDYSQRQEMYRGGGSKCKCHGMAMRSCKCTTETCLWACCGCFNTMTAH